MLTKPVLISSDLNFINQINCLARFISFGLIAIMLAACGGGSGSSSSSDSPANPNYRTNLTLDANPGSLETGQTATITWFAENAISCRADDGQWTTETSTTGRATVGPMRATETFSMTCLDAEGGAFTERVRVIVNDLKTTPQPTLDLTANVTSVNLNGTSTIRWNTTNANSCSANGGWTNQTATSGRQQVGPLTSTTNFRMTCIGAGGTIRKTITIVVAVPPTPAPAPTLNLTADNSSISQNGATRIRWTTTDATACTAAGGWTSKTTATGNQFIASIANTTTYNMTCTGDGGTVTKSVTVNVIIPTVDYAELTWNAPTTNQDGSQLNDLAGFIIYYGTNRNSLNQVINVNNPSVTTYMINNLSASTYYFSVSAIDADGNESVRSNIAAKAIQ